VRNVGFNITGTGFGDIFTVNVGDIIDGGGGSDQINLSWENVTTSVQFDLSQTTNHVNFGSTVIKNFESIGTIRTGSGNDTIDLGQAPYAFTRIETGNGDDTIKLVTSSNSSVNYSNAVYGGAGTDWIVANYTSLNYGGNGIYNEANRIRTRYLNSSLLYFESVEQFNITGTGFGDVLVGGAGSDILIGGAGSDNINGGDGNDTIIGVNPYAATPGVNEIDTLAGGGGSDRIILGNNTKVFYDDSNTTSAGTGDYARITNFNPTEDVIQLKGPKTNYRLATSPITGISGTAIFLDKPGSEPDELIAIIEGVTGLDINSGVFVEVQDEIAFSATNYKVLEDGTTQAAINLTRTFGNIGEVRVTLNLDNGTAIAGEDYNNTPIEVIFAQGEMSKTIYVPLTDDTVFEGNETINLSITNPTNGATIGAQSTAILTISEEPVIAFDAANYSVSEDGTAQITVTRTSSIDGEVGVTVSLANGTGTASADYNNAPITVNFAPGETTKTITIPIQEDFLREGDETVNLSLTNPTDGVILGAQSTATLTIADNDIGLNAEYYNGYFNDNFSFFGQNQPVFQRTDATVNFANNTTSWNLNSVAQLADLETFSVQWRGYINIPTAGNYTFYLNSDDASYLFLDNATQTPSAGNATVNNSGVHSSQEIAGLAYLEAGFHEVLILFGENGGGNNISFSWSSQDVGITKQIVPSSVLFTLTNVDVPAFLSFSTTNYNVNEENGFISIDITRTARTTGQVSANISLTNGTATYPSDYNQNLLTVNFADGETSKTINIPIVDDTKFEPNETINLALTNLTGGATLGSQSTAILTIISEDLPAPGKLAFSRSNFSVNEDGTPVITVSISRTDGSDGEVSVTITPSDGTAIAASDYSNDPITVTFANQETSKTVTIPITNDSIYEDTETVILTLTNLTNGATLGAQNTTTLNIVDNDAVPGVIEFSTANYTVNENGTPVTAVTLTRTNGSDGAASVTLNLSNGSATAPSDYLNNPITVNFANGETSKTVTIPIIDDTKFEPNETINLALTNLTSGATLGSQSTATLTIISEDLPAPGTLSRKLLSYPSINLQQRLR
jgi:Calx-beta domain/PA14 domain/RTX calcium-binding nonapeptide repeat (4 copies)